MASPTVWSKMGRTRPNPRGRRLPTGGSSKIQITLLIWGYVQVPQHQTNRHHHLFNPSTSPSAFEAERPCRGAASYPQHPISKPVSGSGASVRAHERRTGTRRTGIISSQPLLFAVDFSSFVSYPAFAAHPQHPTSERASCRGVARAYAASLQCSYEPRTRTRISHCQGFSSVTATCHPFLFLLLLTSRRIPGMSTVRQTFHPHLSTVLETHAQTQGHYSDERMSMIVSKPPSPIKMTDPHHYPHQ